MLPIHLFIIMLIIQICGYKLLDKYNWDNWKYLLLGIGLILDFFILPDYFMPVYRKGEFRCGMPAMGINLAFWFIGGGSLITTHIVYSIVKRVDRKK